jgi:hypothetical protein
MQNFIKSSLSFTGRIFIWAIKWIIAIILTYILFMSILPIFDLKLIPEMPNSYSRFISNIPVSSQNSIGNSMDPNLKNGTIALDIHTSVYKPRIGDIIRFECKDYYYCYDPTRRTKDNVNRNIQHRLTAIDANGCMSIVGDNQENSYDTNDFGCLMPEEITINGTTWVNNNPIQ